MRRYRRHRACKVCGARYPFVTVSARGLCPDHIVKRIEENATQLRAHEGPYFQRWREAMAASVGGSLVDARESER